MHGARGGQIDLQDLLRAPTSSFDGTSTCGATGRRPALVIEDWHARSTYRHL